MASEPISLDVHGYSRTRTNAGWQDSRSDETPSSHSVDKHLTEGKHTNLGGKTLNYIDSLALTINSVTGPGIVALPLLYHKAGWLLPTIFMVLFAAVSSIASTMLCEAMRLLPGNRWYQKRIEFATLVREYFGYRWYILTQIFFNLTLSTHNIAAIVVTAQVLDEVWVFLLGKSWAVQLLPSLAFVEDTEGEVGEHLFGEYGVVLTLGYLSAFVICMPMGFLNLDENIYFQYISFFVLFAIAGIFGYEFFDRGLDSSGTPVVGSDISTSAGICLFSFTYVVTIPSWVNEKQPYVSVNKTIWYSNIVSVLLFVFIGWFGSLAYPDITSGNILELMAQHGASTLNKISVYVFSVAVMGLGIPHFAVMIRYNLFVGGLLGSGWSSFWGVAFPWLIGFLLYQGSGFTEFVNWTSILFSGVVNFLVPAALYYKARKLYGEEADRLDAIDETAQILDQAAGPAKAKVNKNIGGRPGRADGAAPLLKAGTHNSSAAGYSAIGTSEPIVGLRDDDSKQQGGLGRSSSGDGLGDDAARELHDAEPPEDREPIWTAFPASCSERARYYTLWTLVIVVEALSLATMGMYAAGMGGGEAH